ncbi:MAG TPA: hypothetical protein VGH15_03440, partial [Caulobacteraceae bacterium]
MGKSWVFAAIVLGLSACSVPAMKEYAWPAWDFAVSFRGPPKETDIPATADGAGRHSFLVQSNLAGRDDLVIVIDGTGSPRSEDQALTDAPGNIAKAAGATLGPITYAGTGAVVGREFLLSKPGRPAARARVFVFHQHLYEL